jgi:hypothetical protein
MTTILVISFTDSKRDPRAQRQIEALRTHHTVIPAGTGDPELPDVRFVGCEHNTRRLRREILHVGSKRIKPMWLMGLLGRSAVAVPEWLDLKRFGATAVAHAAPFYASANAVVLGGSRFNGPCDRSLSAFSGLSAGLTRVRPTSLEKTVQVSDGVLRRHAVEVVDDIIEGGRAFSFLPWRVISFGAWMKRFDVQVDG